jgi:hypothetical protein
MKLEGLKMNKATFGLVFLLIVLCFSLGFEWVEKEGIKANLESLNKLHNKLSTEYTLLSSRYENLNTSFSELSAEYALLTLEYENLSISHGDLIKEYNLMYDSRYDEGYVDGNETGFETGYDSGYIQGVGDGAGRGYTIRDLAYQEMLNFLALDQTDKNMYVEGTYTCWNFAADVKYHAFLKGYKCGLVYIEFPGSAHAVVCFNTTDQGLFYIEPQNDAIMRPVVGQFYWDRTKYNPPLYNDTIIYMETVW